MEIINSEKEDSFEQVVNLIINARANIYTVINKSLVKLYWSIGEYVSKKVVLEEWGKSTVKELALFIKNEHPDLNSMIQFFYFKIGTFFI